LLLSWRVGGKVAATFVDADSR